MRPDQCTRRNANTLLCQATANMLADTDFCSVHSSVRNKNAGGNAATRVVV